ANVEASTAIGQMMGTPQYISPEQALGHTHRVDRRTDVYALGATLYELLTGGPPFAGANAVEIIVQVLRSEPAPPRQRDPSIPRDLETVILRCLEKHPQHRYDSARP